MQARGQQRAGPGRKARREPQTVTARHGLLQAPDGGAQRGVERAQGIGIELEQRGQGVDARWSGQRQLVRPGLPIRLQGAKISLRLAIQAQRRQERAIVIARGKAEARTLVVAQDLHDVVAPDLVARAAHARRAVVVGGDRQRPAAQQAVVVGEQLRRGLGRAVGVEPFIDRTIDAQVTAPGRADELPQARRPGLRHRCDLKR